MVSAPKGAQMVEERLAGTAPVAALQLPPLTISPLLVDELHSITRT
jgi:hypothetical protein